MSLSARLLGVEKGKAFLKTQPSQEEIDKRIRELEATFAANEELVKEHEKNAIKQKHAELKQKRAQHKEELAKFEKNQSSNGSVNSKEKISPTKLEELKNEMVERKKKIRETRSTAKHFLNILGKTKDKMWGKTRSRYTRKTSSKSPSSKSRSSSK